VNFRDAIAANQKAVMTLSRPQLKIILPVLYEIREETAKAFYGFFKKNDLSSKYDKHKHRALLSQLDDAIKIAEKKLPATTLKELKTEAQKAIPLSVKNLQAMIISGEKQFRDAVTPLRLPVAKIVASQEKTLMSQYPSSAMKYAGAVGDQIRHDLVVGVVKGESIGQMARRLTDGQFDKLAKKGSGAVAEGIADGQYFDNEADAARLVRTELNNAYNDTQVESLIVANEDDPGWLKKWDAANDDNVCPLCDEMDGEMVEPDEDFPNGAGSGPPLHPNDRCSVVPWRADWPEKL
jgi:SPP1 gp7 family putative phage head morphogenesis protein